MTYATFILKYTQFSQLSGSRYELFLPDVLAEIDRITTWGTLRDRAIEMLLGHVLSLSDSEDYSGKNTSEVEVEDRRWRVAYQDYVSNLTTTSFGIEYERLLKLATGQDLGSTSASRGMSYVGQRGLSIKLEW